MEKILCSTSRSEYENLNGIPDFEAIEFSGKKTKYCLLIPTINEAKNIFKQLERGQSAGVDKLCDVIIFDAGSTDGTACQTSLIEHGVNTLLILKRFARQSTSLRAGFYWALERGYEGVITADGNNKDGIEDIGKFIEKLDEGYDFIQGSRFCKGGVEKNTPKYRVFTIKWISNPFMYLAAGKWYTDTQNNFRAYSAYYLRHERADIFRDIFKEYELTLYLPTRADQLKLKTCEIPVKRIYPKGKYPTKVTFRAHLVSLKTLFFNALGFYRPKKEARKRKAIWYSIFSILLMGIAFAIFYPIFRRLQ